MRPKLIVSIRDHPAARRLVGLRSTAELARDGSSQGAKLRDSLGFAELPQRTLVNHAG